MKVRFREFSRRTMDWMMFARQAMKAARWKCIETALVSQTWSGSFESRFALAQDDIGLAILEVTSWTDSQTHASVQFVLHLTRGSLGGKLPAFEDPCFHLGSSMPSCSRDPVNLLTFTLKEHSRQRGNRHHD